MPAQSQLRKLRKERSLTLTQLAGLAGLSVTYVHQIEMGRRSPSMDTFGKLAKALDIDASRLISSS